MKKILVVIISFIFMLPVAAKHLYKEAVYQEYWCNKHGGILEYELNDKEAETILKQCLPSVN